MKRPKTKIYRLAIRYDESLKSKLTELQRESHLDKATIIRMAILGMTRIEPPPPPLPVCDQLAVDAITRIASNVNQIARRLNEHPWEALGASEVKAIQGYFGVLVEVTLGLREKAELVTRAEAYYQNTAVLTALDRVHGRLKDIVSILKPLKQGEGATTTIPEAMRSFAVVDKMLMKIVASLLGLNPKEELIQDWGLSDVGRRSRPITEPSSPA